MEKVNPAVKCKSEFTIYIIEYKRNKFIIKNSVAD